MSRHFPWLIPLTDLILFGLVGLIAAVVALVSAGPGAWVASRFLCALCLVPPLLAFAPQVTVYGWLAFGFGVATWVVPAVGRHARGFRRLVLRTAPLLVAAELGLVGWVVGGDWLRARREALAPRPTADSPNVLLIVLDTVAAGHLGLYGYPRPTTATLEELAARGVRFDRAIATSSWTLPSHASMFTGRWRHELACSWSTPLGRRFPTLAEHLGGRGYATAGFVANTAYCAYDSGLARGFATYEDYALPRLAPFEMARLVERGLDALDRLAESARFWSGSDEYPPPENPILDLFAYDEPRSADAISGAFLDWLAGRRPPDRPFFAFLNYMDAHYPYLVPPDGLRRFGRRPSDPRAWELIKHWRTIDKAQLSPAEVAEARDAYDSCIADLDERIGLLLDELDRRGVLDDTWIVLTADHGESFGEHGLFQHGTGLYQDQTHVPLLILPPRRGPSIAPRVIPQSVSLRDLPATIADLAGQGAGSPFPGASLARFWRDSAEGTPSGDVALSEVAPTGFFDAEPAVGAPLAEDVMASIVDGEWCLIRSDRKGRDELYDLARDPEQLRDLSADPAHTARLDRMRQALSRLSSGGWTPPPAGR